VPTRVTGELGGFAGSVTPFAAAYESDELVSIGRGGSLTVRFDEPVRDDAMNPFGVDLLVFGNSFFFDPSFNPVASQLWQPGGAIEVSTDGMDWRTVPVVQPDGAFPTLGYSDETNPFGGAAGSVLSDFTKPVNPAFSWSGKNLTEIIAGYEGSGGGAGVDIGSLGLSEISFVRISLAADATVGKIEIDALSDVTAVPTPAAGVLLIGGMGALASRRRRGLAG
jgi:hypothetical protein